MPVSVAEAYFDALSGFGLSAAFLAEAAFSAGACSITMMQPERARLTRARVATRTVFMQGSMG